MHWVHCAGTSKTSPLRLGQFAVDHASMRYILYRVVTVCLLPTNVGDPYFLMTHLPPSVCVPLLFGYSLVWRKAIFLLARSIREKK